jgi:hypothetical protein
VPLRRALLLNSTFRLPATRGVRTRRLYIRLSSHLLGINERLSSIVSHCTLIESLYDTLHTLPIKQLHQRTPLLAMCLIAHPLSLTYLVRALARIAELSAASSYTSAISIGCGSIFIPRVLS